MNQQEFFQEAAFADASYSDKTDRLALNQAMFWRYSHPKHDQDWRQRGAKFLGNIRGKTVLDYGCGKGEEATYLALMGADVTAIDISSVGVELAKKRAECDGVSVNALVMRGDPTSFKNESFDVIHGFGILHHVGLQNGLNEVSRRLRPRGRALFLSTWGT